MDEITREDVLQVAGDLKLSITEEQVQEVLDMYPSEAEADPTGTWELIVEHCLYQIGVE